MQQNYNPGSKLYRGLIVCNINDQNNKIKFELIRNFKSYYQQQTKIEYDVQRLKQHNQFEFEWNKKVTCIAKRDSNHDFLFYVLLVFTKPLNQEIKEKIYTDLKQIELVFSKYSGYASKSRHELELARLQDVRSKIESLEEEICKQISQDNYGIISEDELNQNLNERRGWTQASPNRTKYSNKQPKEIILNLDKTIGTNDGLKKNQQPFDVTIKPQEQKDEVEPLSVDRVLYMAIGISLIGFSLVLYLIFMG